MDATAPYVLPSVVFEAVIRASFDHDEQMGGRRMVLLVTCLVVAGLGGVLAVVAWERASRIATVVSALAAVASVGVAVWAALPCHRSGSAEVRVSKTGRATATDGGAAVSGARGSAAGAPERTEVNRTGDANASGGGDAVSGINWT
jgi:hypothetical protein